MAAENVCLAALDQQRPHTFQHNQRVSCCLSVPVGAVLLALAMATLAPSISEAPGPSPAQPALWALNPPRHKAPPLGLAPSE